MSMALVERPGEGSAAVQARVFLGFDYGTRHVGVATGNTVTGDARPLGRLAAQGPDRLAEIARLVREWQPAGLVVGVPRHPDGAPHRNTQRARRFAQELRERLAPLPVHEVDERYSTVEAARDLGRGADLDAASAAVILRQYLEGLDA
jgi:putative holliday junction resolvase